MNNPDNIKAKLKVVRSHAFGQVLYDVLTEYNPEDESEGKLKFVAFITTILQDRYKKQSPSKGKVAKQMTIEEGISLAKKGKY